MKGKGCYCYQCQKGNVELVDIGSKSYWDPPAWVCPDCQDDIFTDEWAECERCGKELPMEEMEDEYICKECAEKVIAAMKDYMENGTPMTEEQREDFLSIWEGIA